MRTLHGSGAPSPFPDLDQPGLPGYSAVYAADGVNDNPMMNPVQVTNQKAAANEEQGDWGADVPVTVGGGLLPPSPSYGGQPGRANQLGWTSGLRKDRWGRQNFQGQTLVRPSMGAHPPVGPVGFSTRSQRLANGVNDLYAVYLPPTSVIAQSFVTPDAPYNVGDGG